MEVERATCVAPATCVALPGGVILYILFLVQTFILRFKFKGDKLITLSLGVGLH